MKILSDRLGYCDFWSHDGVKSTHFYQGHDGTGYPYFFGYCDECHDRIYHVHKYEMTEDEWNMSVLIELIMGA